LLDHLETSGFTAAPRALGTDASGRELVSYVEGVVVWPDHFELLEPDEALADVARLIRRYHDVATTFSPPENAQWWELAADPTGAAEVVCHNDFAPWNLIRGTDGAWAFIDWDLAAPGRRCWDLGWALLSFIPLTPDRPLEDDAIARRLRVFMEAYGTLDELEAVLDAAVERGEHEAAREGPHAEVWAGAAERVARESERWLALCR
jgi:aminoglycoside phosphotransferase (APT) family kinase protein